MLKSYLEGRTFQIRLQEATSAPVAVPAGVPQGLVLGPILFNFYTADMPGFSGNNLALYADDTMMYWHSFSQIVVLAKIRNQLPHYEKYLNK